MRPNQSHIALTAIARSSYRTPPSARSICRRPSPSSCILPSQSSLPADPALFSAVPPHIGHRSSQLLQILTHKLDAVLRPLSHIFGDGSPIPRIAASSAAVYVPSAPIPHIFPACRCCTVRTTCIRSVSTIVIRASACPSAASCPCIERVAASSGSRMSLVRSADNRPHPSTGWRFRRYPLASCPALILPWEDPSLTWYLQSARFSCVVRWYCGRGGSSTAWYSPGRHGAVTIGGVCVVGPAGRRCEDP